MADEFNDVLSMIIGDEDTMSNTMSKLSTEQPTMEEGNELSTPDEAPIEPSNINKLEAACVKPDRKAAKDSTDKKECQEPTKKEKKATNKVEKTAPKQKRKLDILDLDVPVAWLKKGRKEKEKNKAAAVHKNAGEPVPAVTAGQVQLPTTPPAPMKENPTNKLLERRQKKLGKIKVPALPTNEEGRLPYFLTRLPLVSFYQCQQCLRKSNATYDFSKTNGNQTIELHFCQRCRSVNADITKATICHHLH